jgi:16S rRNA (cytosine967-C5)-methyltransferase
MHNLGTIVACDRDPERLEILKENMARLGARIMQFSRHDWTHGHVPSDIATLAPFDCILVDVPCSNTGVMRRRADLRWRLGQADFARMQQLQIEIVRTLIPLLKPNGVLVYSTCSLEPEENEKIVHQILTEMPILRLETKTYSLPFRDGFDGAFAAKIIRNA